MSIPKTVDQTVDPTKNAETLIKASFSPTVDSKCRPTVDLTVDPIKTPESHENKDLQSTVDSNCRRVDQILDSLENSVSDSSSINTGLNDVGQNILNGGLQVYSSAESVDFNGVGTVDQESTLGSTLRSTVGEKLDAGSFEAVDQESTLGSTVDLDDESKEEQEKVYIVNLLQKPTRNSRAYGLRILGEEKPDVQAMLDEAVKGKQGERTDLKSDLVYNIHEVDRPSRTSRAYPDIQAMLDEVVKGSTVAIESQKISRWTMYNLIITISILCPA